MTTPLHYIRAHIFDLARIVAHMQSGEERYLCCTHVEWRGEEHGRRRVRRAHAAPEEGKHNTRGEGGRGRHTQHQRRRRERREHATLEEKEGEEGTHNTRVRHTVLRAHQRRAHVEEGAREDDTHRG